MFVQHKTIKKHLLTKWSCIKDSKFTFAECMDSTWVSSPGARWAHWSITSQQYVRMSRTGSERINGLDKWVTLSPIIMEVENRGLEDDFSLQGGHFHFHGYGRKGISPTYRWAIPWGEKTHFTKPLIRSLPSKRDIQVRKSCCNRDTSPAPTCWAMALVVPSMVPVDTSKFFSSLLMMSFLSKFFGIDLF